ncbi:hypothetical protein [Spirochaeta africana]|uniref:DUF5723 domain-containing protein n=1 Tax=Spirochaeta africana (strain ATCC 700263 / DSM 8902 / Z-7692) TaxID=889378 RepID=H9UFG9_SPIAZ|nr:hypothetical protein [Spirochaeta africana]AFG36262.1 hypothetical protein Spiaf_0153 [Spirochaeta africana DSM 8902]
MNHTTASITTRLRAALLALGLLLITAGTAAAYPTLPWNHRYNPALLSTGNREYFESGFSMTSGFQNSYWTTGRIFNPTLVIDFDDMYQRIGDGGFKFGANFGGESHFTVHVLDFGAGVYMDSETFFEVGVPKGLFGFLSEGFEMDTTYEGRSSSVLQSFLEYGAYGSYNLEPYTFGVKVGKYVPIAYTRNGISSYSFRAEQDGRIEGTARIEAELYSAVDLEHMESFDAAEVMSGPGGLKLDFGVVYNPDRNKPKWGASFTNIPLYAPLPQYAWRYSAAAGASTDGILDSLDSGDDPFDVDDPDIEFEAMEDSSQRIYMPFRAGGFYRVTAVPLIDIIGHGAVVFAEPFRVNGGVHVEGSFFPLSILSVGLAHEDIAWRSSLGLRVNLRVVELGMQASMSSPEFLGMLSPRGAALSLVAAFGF